MANEAGWSYWSVVPRLKPGSIKGIESQLNGGDFQSAGRHAGDTLGTNIGTSAKKRVGIMSRGILAPLLAVGAALKVKDFLGDSLAEARESQKVGALTRSIIKSTGGAAKMTAKDIDKLSTSLSNKTGTDDEAIASGANLLLTFKNVKREGKGLDDVFGRATAAAADLSAAGFGDITGTAKQLGKALNDPLKGISALGKAGVTFTEGQKAQIKTLVSQNDLLGAQKIILKEVESQVGGAAAATATLGEKSTVAWDNIKEGLGTALLPLVDDVQTAFLDKGIPAAEKFTTWFTDEGVPALRDFGEEVGPLAKSTLPALGSVLGGIADTAGALAPSVKSLVDSFNSLPDGVKTAIVAGGGALALGNKLGVALPAIIPTGSPKSDKPGKDGKDGKPRKTKGGGSGLLGAIPILGAGAVAAMDPLNQAYDTLFDNAPKMDLLVKSFDNLGRSTKVTGIILDEALVKSNFGAHAADLGIDVASVSDSLKSAGTSGVAYRDALASIDQQTRDAIASGQVGKLFELGDARRDLEEVGAAYDTASEKAIPAKKRQDDLKLALLGGDKAAQNMLTKLGQVDSKKVNPKITTPGMGAAIGSAGTLISQLNAIDGKNVSAMVRLNKTGANLGGIIGQLNEIARKGSSGGGKVRGFDGGGWTGPGARLQPAGIVHADEFVLKKTSRQSIERQAPGALDAMNRSGELVTAGGGGGYSSADIGLLVDEIRSLKFQISDREFGAIVKDANYANARKR